MISNTNQIELRHIRYFLALAEELHYQKAADRLFVSQSALSQQIKQLEGIVGSALFDRTNRKVSLNKAGQLFKEDVSGLMAQVSVAMEHQALLRKGVAGRLRIGFVASAMQSVLPAMLTAFEKDHEQVQIEFEELPNESQLPAVASGKLDIGFVRTSNVGEGLQLRKVHSESFVLVLPKGHPKSNFQNLAEYKDEHFILFPNDKSSSYFQQILSMCADHGFVPNIKHKSIHAPTIFKLVSLGMGVSILPASLADANQTDITFVPLKSLSYFTDLFMIWRTDNRNATLGEFLAS